MTAEVSLLETEILRIPMYHEGEWKFSCCGRRFEWNKPHQLPDREYCPDCYTIKGHRRDGWHSREGLILDENGLPMKIADNSCGLYRATIGEFRAGEFITGPEGYFTKDQLKEIVATRKWTIVHDKATLTWSLERERQIAKKIHDFVNGNWRDLYGNEIVDEETLGLLEAKGRLKLFVQRALPTLINMNLAMFHHLELITKKMNDAGCALVF